MNKKLNKNSCVHGIFQVSVYWITGLNGEKDGKHDSSWSVMQGEILFRLQLEVIKAHRGCKGSVARD